MTTATLVVILAIMLILCETVNTQQSGLIGLAVIIPSFHGEHGDLNRFAFIMMILIFILGLARIVFTRPKDDKDDDEGRL